MRLIPNLCYGGCVVACVACVRRLAGGVTLAALLAGAVALAALLSACSASGTGGGGLQVVAAENFWGSIAGQLAGTKAHVHSVIVNPAQDPHDYEPTAADARTLAGAKLATA